MKLKQLFEDDDAVSPVIGVILMVAITVILAAVIGTFVLGLGDQVQSTSPNTNFNFDYDQDATADGDELDVTHDGGDAVAESRLTASVSGAVDAGNGDDPSSWTGTLFGDTDSKVTAGSTDTMAASGFTTDTGGNPGDLDLTEATVRVVWTSEGGDQSSTVAKWSGPDA